MKRLLILTFTFLSLVLINSCAKESDGGTDKEVVAEKTNVKTFEIIDLVTKESLDDKYNATFGSVDIELVKTSDTTLTFFVPNVEEGEATLIFELAKIKFNVTKTPEVDAEQLVLDIVQKVEDQIELLNPETPEEIAEVNSLNDYMQEVVTLFKSLSTEEKQQTAQFYEANKEVFKSFSTNTFQDLDASTTFRKQSECPRKEFFTYYSCTAKNLGDAAVGVKNTSKEFLQMLLLAGSSAYLAPASLGLSAFGTTLALGTAGYLLIAEVKPAVTHFKFSLIPFLRANWIFTKALFIATVEVFQEEISTSLNLTPKFRSISSSDGDISTETSYFISAMSLLSEYWNKLTALFGSFPSYSTTEVPATLATEDITISNISNPNVKYLGNTGQSVKFKSQSGKDENFSYKIRVTKEGFVEEKILFGKVTVTDSLSIYIDYLTSSNWYIETYGYSESGDLIVNDLLEYEFYDTGKNIVNNSYVDKLYFFLVKYPEVNDTRSYTLSYSPSNGALLTFPWGTSSYDFHRFKLNLNKTYYSYTGQSPTDYDLVEFKRK